MVELGLSPSEFWDSTDAEIQSYYEAWKRREQRLVSFFARPFVFLINLLGSGLFSSQEKKWETVHPESLFPFLEREEQQDEILETEDGESAGTKQLLLVLKGLQRKQRDEELAAARERVRQQNLKKANG